MWLRLIFPNWNILDMLKPLAEPSCLLDYNEEGESAGNNFLVSEEVDDDDSSFFPPVQTFNSPHLS